VAVAEAVVRPGEKIMQQLINSEIHTKKGPVFQTAILAGVMAAKKTSDLIPLCHPLPIDDCQLQVKTSGELITIVGTVKTTGRTGVEMEALTAVSVAALTIYDMCKALSHTIRIEHIRLLEKTGGKQDFKAS
jgi:cyclic pyranopterin monophosphate synthase